MRLLVYAAVIGFTPINLAALGRRFFKLGLAARSVSALQASAYEGPLGWPDWGRDVVAEVVGMEAELETIRRETAKHEHASHD
jgi:hypothetical protein